ncbi:hypothetical protein TNIN_419611 [Trichonephila inaurata madagascariensis]|uniref:Uncharacterized protein n=1 Tax=Trichonephila inaurata madagascariensis TaxID=2747483 RepID=A0A8X7CHZ9_9ARAC|nr:hypothetical protein TNIN_419611 [Trichonephila inaurata madagascariensis]
MSDYSGNLDFSPTRQAKTAACEKLRDTVTGISALHKSLLDESLASSPTHRNSFSEIYRMSTQAMAMKKEEMIANPELSSIIRNSYYMDDLMSRASSNKEAILWIQALEARGFESGVRSNSRDVLINRSKNLEFNEKNAENHPENCSKR